MKHKYNRLALVVILSSAISPLHASGCFGLACALPGQDSNQVINLAGGESQSKGKMGDIFRSEAMSGQGVHKTIRTKSTSSNKDKSFYLYPENAPLERRKYQQGGSFDVELVMQSNNGPYLSRPIEM